MNKNRTGKEWEALIQEQESSGLSAHAFCRHKGISSSFFYKKRKQISRDLSSETFVSLEIPDSYKERYSQVNMQIFIGPFEIRPGMDTDQKQLYKIFTSVLEAINA